jgi:hypothetical protein
MPRTAKTKKKPSEKEVCGDGFEAIPSVAVDETTSLNLQKKSQRTVIMKSKIAGSKKKTSKAATSTSEELPIPEDGARKRPPEELVEVEKPKQKVTTLWSRGKLNRVVIVDLPKGKDTGPPSNGLAYPFASSAMRIAFLLCPFGANFAAKKKNMCL